MDRFFGILRSGAAMFSLSALSVLGDDIHLLGFDCIAAVNRAAEPREIKINDVFIFIFLGPANWFNVQ